MRSEIFHITRHSMQLALIHHYSPAIAIMKLALLAALHHFILPNDNDCIAFQCSLTSRSASSSQKSISALRNARNGGDGEGYHDVPTDVTRRSILSAGAAVALPLLGANPSSAIGGSQSSVRVESWPGIEGLEPLYEFKLSVDAIVKGVQDPANWDFVQKRLKSFLGGFIINEKNYFMGVGLQYMNEIKYDPNELPNYVLLDKESRFEALDSTMKNLESLKKVLADKNNRNADVVNDLALASQSSLQSFFSLIPDQDVKAVEELFVDVKKADTNGDGRLSDDELVFLHPVEQEIWKRRVEKF